MADFLCLRELLEGMPKRLAWSVKKHCQATMAHNSMQIKSRGLLFDFATMMNGHDEWSHVCLEIL
jgi:hypothetical protein